MLIVILRLLVVKLLFDLVFDLVDEAHLNSRSNRIVAIVPNYLVHPRSNARAENRDIFIQSLAIFNSIDVGPNLFQPRNAASCGPHQPGCRRLLNEDLFGHDDDVDEHYCHRKD